MGTYTNQSPNVPIAHSSMHFNYQRSQKLSPFSESLPPPPPSPEQLTLTSAGLWKLWAAWQNRGRLLEVRQGRGGRGRFGAAALGETLHLWSLGRIHRGSGAAAAGTRVDREEALDLKPAEPVLERTARALGLLSVEVISPRYHVLH